MSLWGSEVNMLRQAAARTEIKCPVCRMKFPTDEQLKRHRKNFCVKPSADSAANDAAAAGTTNTEQAASGGPSSPGRAPPAGITRQDLGGFVAAYAVNSKAVISGSSQALSESQKELGALTLEQLKRKMFSSSFADLQTRALHEQQQALAAKLRAYKLSAALPPHLQDTEHGKGGRKREASVDGLRPKAGWHGQAGEGGGTRSRPEDGEIVGRKDASIAALLAMQILQEQSGRGVKAPMAQDRTRRERDRVKERETEIFAELLSERAEGAAPEHQRGREGKDCGQIAVRERREKGRRGGAEEEREERDEREDGVVGGRDGQRQRGVVYEGERVRGRTWERGHATGQWVGEREDDKDGLIELLRKENEWLKRERGLMAENEKLKAERDQLKAARADGNGSGFGGSWNGNVTALASENSLRAGGHGVGGAGVETGEAAERKTPVPGFGLRRVTPGEDGGGFKSLPTDAYGGTLNGMNSFQRHEGLGVGKLQADDGFKNVGMPAGLAGLAGHAHGLAAFDALGAGIQPTASGHFGGGDGQMRSVGGENDPVVRTNWGDRGAEGAWGGIPRQGQGMFGVEHGVGEGMLPTILESTREDLVSAVGDEPAVRGGSESPMPHGLGGGCGVLREADEMAAKHSLEMARLDQETEKLKMVKELRQMENEMAERRQVAAREVWLVQQRRALMEAMHLRSLILPGSNYDPVEGFMLRFDILQPLPGRTQQTQLVYGFYDGASALMPLQNGPVREVVTEVSESGGRRSWIALSRTFKKLPPSEDVVCIVEVQDVALDGVSTSVGWTVVPVFDKNLSLLEGAWRVPLLEPPIKLHLTTPAAAARKESFDLLLKVPRIRVERFDVQGENFRGAQLPGARDTEEASLYVRLRPSDPAPSPDDVDYELKMTEAARLGRVGYEWPDPHLPDYRTAHIFSVSTPSWIRRPYTPPGDTSRSRREETEAETSAKKALAGKGGADAAHGRAARTEAARGAEAGRAMPPKVAAGHAQGQGSARGKGPSLVGVPAEAWAEGGKKGDEEQGHVECEPDDELLIILDGARFLPDNVSLCCAKVSMVKHDGSEVQIATTSARHAFGVPNARAQGPANLHSWLHSPTFQLSCSFRMRDCDPSAFIVVRIDALDLHQPRGAPPVCVGLACFSPFRTTDSGRALSDEQGEQYLDAIRDAEAEAKRRKLGEVEAKQLMPKVAAAAGGWQIPLRSVWPLRGLWRHHTTRDRVGKTSAGEDHDPASAAHASLVRFAGGNLWEDGHGKQGREAAASGEVREESLHMKLVRKLVGRTGARGDGDAAVTTRMDQIGPRLINDLPRLPCASVLLRVLVNPTEADMMTVLKHAGHLGLMDEIEARQRDLAAKQARVLEEGIDEEEAALRDEEGMMRAAIVRTKPVYANGFYNSQATVPSGVERAMLPHKLASMRRGLCAKDLLQKLLPAGDPGAFDDEDDPQEDVRSEEFLRGASAKLFHPGADGAGADEGDDQDQYALGGVLDLSYISAYVPTIGFQVAVDGANNLRVEKGAKGEIYWPVAVVGVLPVSSYFALDAARLLTANTWFVSNLHVESTTKCPRWQEGAHHVYDVPFLGHRVALIVQILGMARVEVQVGTRTVTEIARKELGWSAMPLFLDNLLPYIIDGHFQVPVYNGAVPPSLAADIEQMGCEETLREYERSKLAVPMPAASVLVRLIDMQRGATSDGLLQSGGYPNPVPPSDPGIPPEVRDHFLRYWPSLASAGEGETVETVGATGNRRMQVQRIAGKDLPAYFKIASNGLFGKPDPLISSLLQKVKRKDENDKGKDAASVHGGAAKSVVSVAGGGSGKKSGMTVAAFHHQLRFVRNELACAVKLHLDTRKRIVSADMQEL